jgi:exodeoxyribonuclease VII large subunit
VAEVSGHTFYADRNRHYFDFVEKGQAGAEPIAKVKGVAWSKGDQQIKIFEAATGQHFTNGIQILARVKVEFSAKFGLSLILEDIDYSYTLGNLEKQRRETLARLIKENPDAIQLIDGEYATRNKSVKTNLVLQRIAVIGSPNSDGYTDFLHTLTQNQYGYKFVVDIFQSSVQGETAAPEMVKCLIEIYGSTTKYDSVVFIRGGGSKVDFLAFDHYVLAKAVARFPIPVITGLGHHRDVSIVDMMAHTSTKTPTKAAEWIVANNRSFEEEVERIQKALVIRSQQNISRQKNAINNAHLVMVNNARLVIQTHQSKLGKMNQLIVRSVDNVLFDQKTKLLDIQRKLTTRPEMFFSARKNEIIRLSDQLQLNVPKLLASHSKGMDHLASMIRLMSPQSILKRGFAMVSVDGKVVSDASKIEVGMMIDVRLGDQILETTVNKKEQDNGSEYDV